MRLKILFSCLILLITSALAGCGQTTISSNPPAGIVTPDMYVSATYSTINMGGYPSNPLPGSYQNQNTLTVKTFDANFVAQDTAAITASVNNGAPVFLTKQSVGNYSLSTGGTVTSLTLNATSPGGIAMSGSLSLPANTAIPVTINYGTFSQASGGAIGWSPVAPQPSNYIVFIFDVTNPAVPTVVAGPVNSPFWNIVAGNAAVDPADNKIRFSVPPQVLVTGRQYLFCVGLLNNSPIANAKAPSLITGFSINFTPLVGATAVNVN